MSAYSVANAKSSLPSLINRAMAGEEVIITRHGRPVVELRAMAVADSPSFVADGHDWFLSRRVKLSGSSPTSVELLNMIHDEPEA